MWLEFEQLAVNGVSREFSGWGGVVLEEVVLVEVLLII